MNGIFFGDPFCLSCLFGHFGGTLTLGANYHFTFPQSSFDSGDSTSTIANNQTTEHIVEIKQMKFIPDYIDVAKGDRITFINKDVVAHDVTELKDRKWTSSILEAGDSWTMTATRDEDYFCILHIIMERKISKIK